MTKTKTFIFQTHSSNNEYNGDCDFGVVVMTPERLVEILERQILVKQLGSQDGALAHVSFWDYGCNFAKNYDELDKLTDTDSYASEGHMVAPEGFELDEGERQRIEAARMVVTDTYVWWVAVPKHSDIEVETAQISIDDLKALMSPPVRKRKAD